VTGVTGVTCVTGVTGVTCVTCVTYTSIESSTAAVFYHQHASIHRLLPCFYPPVSQMPVQIITYYDPNASRMRSDTLANFLRAPLTGNVEEVPGIGKDTKTKLQTANVCTTQQLMGIYLQHSDCNTFYKWLQRVGVHAHRNTVVRCIAEKTQSLFGDCPPTHQPTTATLPATPTCNTIMEDNEEEEHTQESVATKKARKNARKKAHKKAKKASQKQ
jgi:hypothetical protein